VAFVSRARQAIGFRASIADSRRMKSFAPVRSQLNRRRAARVALGMKYLGSTIRRRLRAGDVTQTPVHHAACLRLPLMEARFLSEPQRDLGGSSRSGWMDQFRMSMSVAAHVLRVRMAAPPVRWEKTQPRSRNRQAVLVESTAISSSTLARTCTQSVAPRATAASPAKATTTCVSTGIRRWFTWRRSARSCCRTNLITHHMQSSVNRINPINN
jgi:hypothetical protein